MSELENNPVYVAAKKAAEDAQAALRAAEQQAYELERAAKEEKRKVQLELERQEQAIKDAAAMLEWEKVAKLLVTELVAVGFTKASYSMPTTGRYPSIVCIPNESYSTWHVKFEEVYSRSRGFGRFSARETKIVVGSWDAAHRYPALKAGGFNYKKIAATAWEMYQVYLAKKKRENTQEENKKLNEERINRLNNQFGKPAYKGSARWEIKNVKLSHYTFYSQTGRGGGGGGSYTYRTDNNLMLHIDSITEENAAKLIQFMLDNGMIQSEEK